jgi:hypothetical protein
MAKKSSTKPTPLTKADKFYIENNADTLSLSELSQDIGKTQKVIDEHISTLAKGTMPNVDSLLGKGARGSVVMTEAASSLADDRRKVMPDKTPDKARKFIHKIKE